MRERQRMERQQQDLLPVDCEREDLDIATVDILCNCQLSVLRKGKERKRKRKKERVLKEKKTC